MAKLLMKLTKKQDEFAPDVPRDRVTKEEIQRLFATQLGLAPIAEARCHSLKV